MAMDAGRLGRGRGVCCVGRDLASANRGAAEWAPVRGPLSGAFCVTHQMGPGEEPLVLGGRPWESPAALVGKRARS